jgi:hypothetical protein
MATIHSNDADSTEVCPVCDVRTPHDVDLEIVTESSSDDADAAKFSREPYRVVECLRCGETRKQRMNNA